jgi:hypothetical protein
MLALVQIRDARPLKRGGMHEHILAAAIQDNEGRTPWQRCTTSPSPTPARSPQLAVGLIAI